MRSSWCLFSLLLAACSGQSGGEAPGPASPGGDFSEAACLIVDIRELARDEVAPIGFSAQDMLDLAEGVSETRLAYSETPQASGQAAQETALTLALSYQQGLIEFIDLQADTSSDAAQLDRCEDRIEVQLSALVRSDDGQFNERLSTRLVATQPRESGFTAQRAAEDIEGDFRFAEDSASQRQSLQIEALFSQGDGGLELRGRITGLNEQDNSDGSTTTSQRLIGIWPPNMDQ